MATSPPCMASALPVELLHRIFEFLEPQDILAARKTCVLLAAIGADHMLDEVLMVYKRERLQRLIDIAKHPTLSHRVKSFYLQGDRFRVPMMTYEKWDKRREDAIPRRVYNICDEISNSEISHEQPWSERTFRAIHRAHKRYDRIKKGNHGSDELEFAYKAYQGVLNDQMRVREEAFDVHSLTEFFRACSKLEAVTLSLGHGRSGWLEMNKMAFQECMCSPLGDETILDQGVDQFNALIEAMGKADFKPKHLSILDVSYRVMRPGLHLDLPILAIMPHLHTFRLGVEISWDELPDEEIEAVTDMITYVNNGQLRTWLAAATNLRTLKLRLSHFQPDTVSASLRWSLGQTTWPRLQNLGLADFQASEDELIDLLLRHKSGLRSLALSSVVLTSGNWESVFQRLAGTFPKLQKLSLRNYLMEGREIIFDFDVPGALLNGVDPVRDAIENYILNGGDEFPDLDEVEAAFDREYGDLMDARGTFLYPDDLPGYTAPQRIDAESADDDGYTSDGSAVSYVSDDFDGTI